MQSKIDKISQAALQELQIAMSSLVGSDILCNLQSASLIKKDVFLDQQDGRNILTGLLLKGTYRGEGCLVISQKSGLRIVGKMVMLSPAEMNEIIAESGFKEEIAYAFEEIVRTVVASFIKPFQSSSLFISTIVCRESRAIVDRPDDGLLEFLTPEKTYYQVRGEIIIDGMSVGALTLLLPAFLLVCSSLFNNISDEWRGDSAARVGFEGTAGDHPLPGDRDRVRLRFDGKSEPSEVCDALFLPELPSIANELGELVGSVVSIHEQETFCVRAEDAHLSLSSAAHVSSLFSLQGVPEESICLIAELDVAQWLGALLTDGVHGAVLARLQGGSLDADRQDGFNEIGAILMNAFARVCRAETEIDLDFSRTGFFEYGNREGESLEYEISGDHQYHVCSLKLATGALGSGVLYLLIPSALSELLLSEQQPLPDATITAVDCFLPEPLDEKPPVQTDAESPWDGTVLIIDADGMQAEAIKAELDGGWISSDLITSLAEINKNTLEAYSAIILVIESLNEMTLGLAIKINSLCSVPLIVAASQWTQSEVLKAVRYGVSDILMTPVLRGEILQKIRDLERLSV